MTRSSRAANDEFSKKMCDKVISDLTGLKLSDGRLIGEREDERCIDRLILLVDIALYD